MSWGEWQKILRSCAKYFLCLLVRKDLNYPHTAVWGIFVLTAIGFFNFAD